MNRIIVIAAIYAGVASAPLFGMQPNTAQTVKPEAPSKVINPKVPSQATFAGKKIDTDRYDMYERLDRELSAMAYTHGSTMLTIKRANRYFPEIIPVLQAAGVPTDLVYLACIESSLDPRAYSPSKAAGFWQFLAGTAKEYGLEVNEYVDERYDPVKSTQAAVKYLKDAYKKYGTWESAAASYNGGMGRITRELAEQGVDSAYDLYLTEETSRYMFRLLAMKMIMENPRQYGFELKAENLYNPMKYTEVEVNTPVESWAKWAKEHGTNYMILRDYNPWIRTKSLPNKTGKTYTVRVPVKESLSHSKSVGRPYNPDWVVK